MQAPASNTAPLVNGSTIVTRRVSWLCALVSLWLATWAVSHPYKGVFHDARLYTLQALAHLQPKSLSHDVFLRSGSQDHFTVFSPVYAAVIRLVGVDHAAALLTFFLQIAFFCAAATLARQVSCFRMAALGLSLLIAIPGYYGADAIFACVEPFVTPRMAAEALVLCGLAAALDGRSKLSVVLVSAASALHPVMAAAGIAALLCLHLAIPRPRLAALLCGTAVILLVALAMAGMRGSLGSFDPVWLGLVEARSPYLFLRNWSLEDWGRLTVPVATLLVGTMALQSPRDHAPGKGRARTLALMSLLTVTGGLLLTLVACDWLQLVLFTQLQPWRWQWLATAVSALLLPLIGSTCWKQGVAGKTTAALLGAAWIFASGTLALATAAGAVLATLVVRRLRPTEARWVLRGACGALLIALVMRIASNLLFTDTYSADPRIPLWIRQVSSVVHDGTVPFAIAIAILALASQPRGVRGVALLALLTTTACVALTPDTWALWSQQQFSPALQARFAPWRALIPPGKDVFWSELALQTWVLLDRPSYLSVIQTSGVLFSRDAALEMQRRAIALGSVVPARQFLDLSGGGAGFGPPREQLERACATGEFDFLISGTRLSWNPMATLPKQVWRSSGGLALYRCSDRPGA